MPQRPKAFTIGDIHVVPHERSAQVRTGPGMAAPARFSAQVETRNPDLAVVLDVLIDDGGLPIVQRLGVYPRERTALTSTTLRGLLLDPVVRAAVKAASRPAVERPDVAPNAFQAPGEEGANEAWVSLPAGADKRVREAAQRYREALASGSRSPAADAGKAMGLSRPQVARYIRRAREAGLLPSVDDVVKRRPVQQEQETPSGDPGQGWPGIRLRDLSDPASW